MKVIIAGTRTMDNPTIIGMAVQDSGFLITEVVSGGAPGVDHFGEVWAQAHGIPLARFPANWQAHGRRAGPLRNAEMAAYAEALIAIWDGRSRGTHNMIAQARRAGIRIFRYHYEATEDSP